MRRKSGRLILLLGLLLIIVIAVVGYLYLSSQPEGLGLLGAAQPTATSQPQITILVARRAIPENTFLSDDVLDESFTTKRITKTLEIGTDVVVAKSQLRNKVNRVDLAADEPLYLSQFTEASLSFKIDPGKRAFPLMVDQFTGIVGEITPRDYVDVILSGQVDEYFMQNFPLQVECPPLSVEPGGCVQLRDWRFPLSAIEPLTMLTVKTVLEDIEVLKVITITEPAAVRQGEPTPTPVALPSLPRGWILILAVEQQQAEVLQFAVDQGWTTQLVLRAQGDHNLTTTTGITAWILLNPTGPYLVPIPQAIPHPVDPGELPKGVIPARLP